MVKRKLKKKKHKSKPPKKKGTKPKPTKKRTKTKKTKKTKPRKSTKRPRTKPKPVVESDSPIIIERPPPPPPEPIVVHDSPIIVEESPKPQKQKPHVSFDTRPPQIIGVSPYGEIVEMPPLEQGAPLTLEPIPLLQFPPQPPLLRRKPQPPQKAPGAGSGGRRIVAPGFIPAHRPRVSPLRPEPQQPRPIQPLTSVMIPVHNLNRKSCELAFHNYRTKKQLGKGAYGTVFELCDRENKCPYVLKVQSFKPVQDLVEQFMHEVATQITVYEKLGITPAIYDVWYCRPNAKQINAFIVMERMDGDLEHFLIAHPRSLPNDFIRGLVGIIGSYVTDLHKLHIKHNDIADRNILYKRLPHGKWKWVLGDWGLSMYVFHKQGQRWFFDPRIVPFAMNQTVKDRDDVKRLEHQLQMIQSRGVYIP